MGVMVWEYWLETHSLLKSFCCISQLIRFTSSTISPNYSHYFLLHPLHLLVFQSTQMFKDSKQDNRQLRFVSQSISDVLLTQWFYWETPSQENLFLRVNLFWVSKEYSKMSRYLQIQLNDSAKSLLSLPQKVMFMK